MNNNNSIAEWNNRGLFYLEQGNASQAIACLSAALSAAKEACNKGVVVHCSSTDTTPPSSISWWKDICPGIASYDDNSNNNSSWCGMPVAPGVPLWENNNNCSEWDLQLQSAICIYNLAVAFHGVDNNNNNNSKAMDLYEYAFRLILASRENSCGCCLADWMYWSILNNWAILRMQQSVDSNENDNNADDIRQCWATLAHSLQYSLDEPHWQEALAANANNNHAVLDEWMNHWLLNATMSSCCCSCRDNNSYYCKTTAAAA